MAAYPVYGARLLSAYGLGTGLPLLAAAITAGEVARHAATAVPWVERFDGTRAARPRHLSDPDRGLRRRL